MSLSNALKKLQESNGKGMVESDSMKGVVKSVEDDFTGVIELETGQSMFFHSMDVDDVNYLLMRSGDEDEISEYEQRIKVGKEVKVKPNKSGLYGSGSAIFAESSKRSIENEFKRIEESIRGTPKYLQLLESASSETEFSGQDMNRLLKAYSELKGQKIDPNGLEAQRMENLVSILNEKQLKQIVKHRVPFLWSKANVELDRREKENKKGNKSMKENQGKEFKESVDEYKVNEIVLWIRNAEDLLKRKNQLMQSIMDGGLDDPEQKKNWSIMDVDKKKYHSIIDDAVAQYKKQVDEDFEISDAEKADLVSYFERKVIEEHDFLVWSKQRVMKMEESRSSGKSNLTENKKALSQALKDAEKIATLMRLLSSNIDALSKQEEDKKKKAALSDASARVSQLGPDKAVDIVKKLMKMEESKKKDLNESSDDFPSIEKASSLSLSNSDDLGSRFAYIEKMASEYKIGPRIKRELFELAASFGQDEGDKKQKHKERWDAIFSGKKKISESIELSPENEKVVFDAFSSAMGVAMADIQEKLGEEFESVGKAEDFVQKVFQHFRGTGKAELNKSLRDLKRMGSDRIKKVRRRELS